MAGAVAKSDALSFVTRKTPVWPVSPGPILMPDAQPATTCGPASSSTAWSAPFANTGASLTRPAGVLEPHRRCGRPEGVGGWGESQRAIGGNGRDLREERRRIDIGREGDLLARVARWAGADARRPTGKRLRARLTIHREVRPF